jgi:adenosylmethionine-8-amino-7-oxononanoate aminotransferase
MSPPFVISEEQIDRIAQALDKAIARVARALNR